MSSDFLMSAHCNHINGLYAKAIEQYTVLLKGKPDYQLLISRCAAYQLRGLHEKAIVDAEQAIQLDSSRYEGYFRRGISQFHQGCVQAAEQDFKQAQLISSQIRDLEVGQQISLWLSKVNLELSQNKELRDSSQKIATPNFQIQKQVVEEEHISQISAQKDQHQHDQTNQKGDCLHEHYSSGSGKHAFAWKQSETSVHIQIEQESEMPPTKDKINVELTKETVEVSFPINQQSDYNMTLHLAHQIDPSLSLFTKDIEGKQVKIEIMLHKSENVHWNTIELVPSEEPVLEPKKQESQPVITSSNEPQKIIGADFNRPAYPSSAKHKTDWSKMEKELDQELKDEKDDPLNSLFKQIYGNADEETRRAMMKSFQTSGGTVLSTNWKEVKDKDYQGKDRPTAPKGQEWKEYEQ